MDSDELVMSTLVALHDLMKQDLKSFADILPNFLSVWLDIGAGRQMNTSQTQTKMKIRIKALACIENCVKCLEPKDVILLKKDVLKKLSVPLDDRKRLVRRAAVDARNSWCLAN